ncbi:DUF5666 domain-containing protein [Hydrogenophaga luteola]|uniref:DUF5666 domain-containing protein n=1 Tax=Hydrogenophaga luteola TaxID=1591122 RepID=A0ABV7W3M4_9BURK
MKLPVCPTRRWVLPLLLALSGCGGMAPLHQTPGAAACSVASLSNPAAEPSGIGGTGAPAVRGPDPGGIGGTGQVAKGNGIGGTGRPVLAGEEGLGGTGIVGVVTGFASICVNGIEVEYGPSTPVERGGQSSRLGDLAVGQLVALQAGGTGDQLLASRIVVIDAAVGPLTALDAAAGRFEVMGQVATALERSDLQGLVVGDWVRVSGQRISSGEIRATRVQRAIAGQAVVTGPYASSGAGGARVGDTPLTLSSPPDGVVPGQEVGVRGQWVDGRLQVQALQVQPTRAAVAGSREVLLQGYVHRLSGRELQLGYESLVLDERSRIEGGDLGALRVDQPVQVRGRVDERQRLLVERLELRSEGRRGERERQAAPAGATTTPATAGNNSTTGSGSDDSGRGRGRGRGGRDGGGGDSGSSGSSGSGSGGDSGGDSGRGRGRGRGGDSGSSGSGSSGSGSSGSGSSGSGSSGSSSSGSGDSGGDSGRGRGRGRGGRD